MDKVVRRSSSRRPPADGEACYFPRDLSRGAFGGDVFCLQHFLKRQGALNEAPSGYFGEKTEKAVEKWQSREGILPSNGILAWTSRTRYAKVNGLPQPRPGVAAGASTSDGKERTCIDVCSEHSGVQDCQTRCVRNDGERLHACREACQVTFSTACDRAYPASAPGGAKNYRDCLAHLTRSCHETCKEYTS
ncbi:hypothetical protein PPROV_000622300 [Pycnococcus provasolii]|uniref:Peptidoglycan binding-like domain-containing protein n=1 Tax=Pycnococcus provasolii TaxID=41880 RepID=A0A830HPV5_9CHLO|nr:hypothetical protein PPROV_000622300 [Pycnococcus provasolii]